ncbi:ATP-binding protein [Virgibacillus dakarensis]|uniref:ATP-binding protein n=1 Tax=Virgibacillus dakarensis TaxID=1917889 RepID=UPI000B42DB2D|nr:ATP-binding protein [Virgibacillus dakarensis]
MENATKYVAGPEQKLLKRFVCQGCHQQVVQKQLIIPFGPREGEQIIANYGCICDDIKLAEAAERKYNLLKHSKLRDGFNYYSLTNKSLQEATLENYDPTNNNLTVAKQKVAEYIRTFDGEQNLLLSGNYGSGKSHLSISITKKLMEQGFECLFLSFPKLLTKIKRTYNMKDVSEDELLEVIQRADLLVLDDIGAEQQTEWSASKLFEVLDDRAGKATVYTTNLGSAELKEHVNERNFSRMMDNTHVIVMKGSDYRRRAF